MIVYTLLGSLLAAILTGGFVLWRWRDMFPPLPDWTWRNIIAVIALLGTIAGAAVLTAAAWWLLDQMLIMARALIGELMKDPNARPEVGRVLTTIVDAIAWGLKLLLAGVIVVLLSLGIAITPRRIALNKTGAELSGGDGESIPVVVNNKPNDPVPTTATPATPGPMPDIQPSPPSPGVTPPPPPPTPTGPAMPEPKE